MQGLGLVLMEQLLQSPSSGRFHNGWGDYLIPMARDVPRAFNVTLLTHTEGRPASACYSSKGVGEPALCLAMGIPSAVRAALKSYREDHGVTGWFTMDLPITSEKIRYAM